MTFPSGGPGYPQQGGGQQPPGPPPGGAFPQQQPPQHSHQAPAAGSGLPQNLPLLLTIAVAGLGLVQYFLGFAEGAGTVGQSILFALAAAGLAGIHLLPKGPKTLPFAGLFALLSGLEAVDAVIGAPLVSGIAVVVLILALLQLVAGIGAVLLEYDVLKPPASKPSAPQGQYGGQYGQQGQQQSYGQPGQFGQQPQGPVAATGEPSQPFGQPPQYSSPNPPPTTPPPGQQATTYAPMQGQFFQQPPSDQPPGTPPGGFGHSG